MGVGTHRRISDKQKKKRLKRRGESDTKELEVKRKKSRENGEEKNDNRSMAM